MSVPHQPPPPPGARAPGYRPAPPPFSDHYWSEPALDGRTRRWRTTLNLLAVFVVGTGAGLSAAWWLNKPLPAAEAPQPAPAATKAVRPEPSLPAAAPLPSGELPYDGVPDGAGLVPRIPYLIQPLPQTSGDDGVAERSPAKQTAKKTEPDTATKRAKSALGEGAQADRADSAPSRPTASKPAASGSTASKTAASKTAASKTAASKTASEKQAGIVAGTGRAAAARRPASRADKNNEIDRLRQQAVDELWRKGVRERMPDQGAAPYSPSAMQPHTRSVS